MTVRTAGSARPMFARLALSLPMLLVALLTAGCNEIPPLAPYVDFNPPPVELDSAIDADPLDGGRPDREVEPPDRAMPTDEICDGVDNDLDGLTDEAIDPTPCQIGMGVCLRDGMTTCVDGTPGCTAEVVEPVDELCNALDDDCDGGTDEDFEGLGDDCMMGVGECLRSGAVVCLPGGAEAACDAIAGEGAPEMCDGLDNDCDGRFDEGEGPPDTPIVEGCELNNLDGRCIQGTRECDADIGAGEPAWTDCETIGGINEMCNGLDDDCDGNTDEAFTQQYMIGDVCDRSPVDLGCPDEGIYQCTNNGTRAECVPPAEEDCDGRDDNCDGRIDEGAVCGEFVQTACRAWLGWTTDDIGDPAEMWGACPERADFTDTLSCNGAPSVRQVFAEVSIGGDVDAADDRLGVSWQCPSQEGRAVVDFAQRACTVYLGLGPAAGAPEDGAAAWGPCPNVPVGIQGEVSCTSGGDEFRPMPLAIDVDADAVLGLAFRCSASGLDQLLGGLVGAEPRALAAQLQAGTEILIAWADSTVGGAVDWAAVCAPGGDGNPATACVSSNGDGLFHTLRFTDDLDAQDRLAIGVRPLDAP